MEVVVSLAMYLTELALLDQTCLVFPGSHLATAALLLAHTTLSGHYQVCVVCSVTIAADSICTAGSAAGSQETQQRLTAQKREDSSSCCALCVHC
jgi:hypothetical protein